MHWSKEAASFGLLSPSGEVGIGGNHETDSLFCADGRHVHRLDGERNLDFELWRLRFDADCWRVHRSRLNRGSGRRIY
jgi:hypothetical protein